MSYLDYKVQILIGIMCCKVRCNINDARLFCNKTIKIHFVLSRLSIVPRVKTRSKSNCKIHLGISQTLKLYPVKMPYIRSFISLSTC